MLASFPSPPTHGVPIGPLYLHFYGLLIALGIGGAVWLSQRRWERIGGAAGTFSTLAIWGVPGGLVGARLYSVVTSYGIDVGNHWYRAFEIWQGGLGIWGGVAGGVLTGWIGARRHHLRLAPLLDTVAPGLALAQAIGRWGNYFNQELYGKPTSLPWAVHIDAGPGRVAGNYQPTFLYESLWDLAVAGALIVIGRRLRIRRGYLFAAYVALYTAGRFWTEYMRIDPAHRYGPFRINDWVSIGVFVGAAVVFGWKGRPRPGEECVDDPLRPGEPGTAAAANAAAAAAGGVPEDAGGDRTGSAQDPPEAAPHAAPTSHSP